MIYLRGEGETVRNGLNFYPPREWKYSRGFILRIGNHKWSVRYSVKLGKFLYDYKKKA